MKVLVVMGGTSQEREVSLRSGKAVFEALKRVGYDAEAMDLRADNLHDIPKAKPDVVYLALHGKNGEDGTVQGYLDILGIPYTCSGLAASAISMNKILTKKILTYEGLPTAEFITFKKSSYNREALVVESIVEKLGLPLVVKSASQGSSIGTYIVKEAGKVAESIEEAFTFDTEVLVEKFIDGIQLTVTIVGNDNPVVYPIIEITAANEFYDYEAKYTPGMSDHIIPARISEGLKEKVEKITAEAYKAVGCRGVARIDVMADKNENPYILEINTIPGMTATSLVPDAARAMGQSFEELVDHLVKLALEQ